MKPIRVTFLGGLLAGFLAIPIVPARADERHDFRVPSGYLPPAGKCRVWYPGTPPGHQPPPGDCRALSRRVPRGAWLIGHGRRWSYNELHDRRFRRTDFDGRRYLGRKEIYRQGREVRQARKEVYQDRRDLRNANEELRKDRAELRKDIRRGASKEEIIQGRREIRDDQRKVTEAKRDLRRSQNKLQSAERNFRRK